MLLFPSWPEPVLGSPAGILRTSTVLMSLDSGSIPDFLTDMVLRDPTIRERFFIFPKKRRGKKVTFLPDPR